MYPVAVLSGGKKHNHKNPLTITYGGRVEQRQKRILDLIALSDLLALKKGSYHFKIAGDGPQLAQLVAHFKKKDYSNISIEFLGLVAHEAMTDLWASSDISILFSEFEGDVDFHAWKALGTRMLLTPVVTDVSGAEEKITHGRTGFIVAVGDVASMAQIIANLDADRARVEQISNACISSIRDHHGCH